MPLQSGGLCPNSQPASGLGFSEAASAQSGDKDLKERDDKVRGQLLLGGTVSFGFFFFSSFSKESFVKADSTPGASSLTEVCVYV